MNILKKIKKAIAIFSITALLIAYTPIPANAEPCSQCQPDLGDCVTDVVAGTIFMAGLGCIVGAIVTAPIGGWEGCLGGIALGGYDTLVGGVAWCALKYSYCELTCSSE